MCRVAPRRLALRAMAIAMIALIGSVVGVETDAAQAVDDTVTQRYLVVDSDGVSDGGNLSALGTPAEGAPGTIDAASIVLELTHVDGVIAELTEQQAAVLAAQPGLIVEPDSVVTTMATPWGLDRIDQSSSALDGFFLPRHTGLGVTIYVVDTGVSATHTEFAGRLESGADFVDTPGDGTGDCHGHGTHVASVAAGERHGVAPGATIVPVRVLDCAGSGWTSAVAAAVDWAIGVADGPSVLNLSLGGRPSRALDTAITRAHEAGIVTVVAAGNSGGDACDASPGRAPHAVVVAATTRGDAMARFSDQGACVDIAAPGVGIPGASLSSPTGTRTMSGTSQASPHVAGAVALIMESGLADPTSIADRLVAMSADGLGHLDDDTPDRLLHLDGRAAVALESVELEPLGGSGGTLVSVRADGPVTITAGDGHSGERRRVVPDATGVGRIGFTAAAGPINITVGGAAQTSPAVAPAVGDLIVRRVAADDLGWPGHDFLVVRREDPQPDAVVIVESGDLRAATRFGQSGLGILLVERTGVTVLTGRQLVEAGDQ